jgi:hypothetical protein
MMQLDSLTDEEVIQHVWNTAGERTELEKMLAERLANAVDEVEDSGKHD